MSVSGVKDILKDKKKVRFVAESAFKQVDKDGKRIRNLQFSLGSGYLERNELEEVMNNVANDLGVEVSSFFDLQVSLHLPRKWMKC